MNKEGLKAELTVAEEAAARAWDWKIGLEAQAVEADRKWRRAERYADKIFKALNAKEASHEVCSD